MWTRDEDTIYPKPLNLSSERALHLCNREDDRRVHVIQIDDRIFEIIANSREAAIKIARKAALQ